MSRSSPRCDRGQTDPTAALAAVLAVVLGLGAYAVVVADAGPDRTDRSLASPTLERVHDRLVVGGVAQSSRLPDAVRAAGPDGYAVNATLRAAERVWTAGPTSPAPTAAGVDRASRSAAVRFAPGRVRGGSLRVVVWP